MKRNILASQNCWYYRDYFYLNRHINEERLLLLYLSILFSINGILLMETYPCLSVL